MINKIEITELVERNLKVKGLLADDLQSLKKHYKELTGKELKKINCDTCVTGAMDVLRGYIGYNPLQIIVSKEITKHRLGICYTCPNLVKDGWDIPFLGKKDKCGLCHCIVESKAKLNANWINKLGGCPENRWTM